MKTFLLTSLFILSAITCMTCITAIANAQTIDCTGATQAPTVTLIGNRGHICPTEDGTVRFSAQWENGSSEEVNLLSTDNVAIPVEFVGACGNGFVSLQQFTAEDSSEVVQIQTKFRPCPPILRPGS